jgi:hypothetical protein
VGRHDDLSVDPGSHTSPRRKRPAEHGGACPFR